MLTGTPHPAPYNRIWAAAYTDSRTEYFELRTEAEGQSAPYQALWHKELSLGVTLSDFPYMDLSALNLHLEELGKYIAAINSGDGAASHFEAMFGSTLYWLNQNALFLPLSAAIERLQLTYQAGKKLSLAPVEVLANYYKDLQPEMRYLSEHFFDIAETEDMTKRFLNAQGKDRAHFHPLTFGTLTLEVVSKGGNIPYPYDDTAEFLLSGGEVQARDFFAAEVLQTEAPEDLLNFLLCRCLRENLRFHTCKYCGRYFPVGGDSRLEYCDRLIAGSKKTCKEIGSLRLYEKRKAENPAVREYKRSYKAHNARIRYGIMTREEFSAWSKEARRRRDDCIAGKTPLEDFVMWLDSDRM